MSDPEELDEVDEFAGGDRSPPGDPSLPQLLEKLHLEHNFDFRQYKEVSLLRRVRRRMAQVHVKLIADYIAYLDRHPDEHTALLDAILINVTHFFRDPEAWAVLRTQVLPSVIDHAVSSRNLRFWSAGCSSGEEAYSLAMLVAEALRDQRDDYDVKIYATDIDDDALATARSGLYRLEQLKDVPPELVDRYFLPDGQAYRVRRDIRKWCIFGRHDLAQDAPFSHMDLLICRNVLIYFDSDLQERVVPRFQYAVRPEGYLCLGRSESVLGRSRRFVPVDFKWRIFQRTTSSGSELSAEPLAFDDSGSHAFRALRTEAYGGARLAGILESVMSSIIVIDPADIIIAWNRAAESLFEIPAESSLGKKFRDLDVSYRVDGLRARVEEVRATQVPAHIADAVFTRRTGEMMHVNLGIAPFFDERQRLGGVVVCGDDVSEYGRLRDELDRLAEQSATANEELQSTNEELETTNEELQSTNEELETTNEELQSTNEELETTVEELQSINSELGTLNIELERRTSELHQVGAFQHSVLDTLPIALFVLDTDFTVTSWNTGATRMWGVKSESAMGREFFALPIGDVMRAVRDPLHRVRDARHPQQLRGLAYTLPGGERRQATLELMPILSPPGELLGILGVANDDGAGETAKK